MNEIKPIDIIIVSYDRLNYLKRTIDAIKERTLYPHRLIVMDNNSEEDVKSYLRQMKVIGMIDEVVFLPENIGEGRAHNESLKYITSDYCVFSQDDILPPKLHPCYLQRLKHLIDKYEDFGSVCLRINRTRRVNIDENSELIENYKSFPSIFSIFRTEELRAMGDNPFGLQFHWQSPAKMKLIKSMKKKAAMSTGMYADHIGFYDINKGYKEDDHSYHTYSGPEKNNQQEDQPYPDLDSTGANIPVKINDLKDAPEHELRLKYWGMDTGIQSKQETARKWKQRYELGQYVDQYCEEGDKSIDLGCGSEKCNEKQIGIDIYPYPCVDILHTTDDLWFFEDNSIKVITASHHLEHLSDVKKVLNEWDRVLKPGGVIAFIVPDGELRPSTICEPSHKYSFTTSMIHRLMKKYLKYTLLRLGPVPNISERKASIICVAQKPLDRTINKIQEIEMNLSKKAKDEILKGLQGVDARAAEKDLNKQLNASIDEVNSSVTSEEIIEITE